jgi:hypothetical protein
MEWFSFVLFLIWVVERMKNLCKKIIEGLVTSIMAAAAAVANVQYYLFLHGWFLQNKLYVTTTLITLLKLYLSTR